MRRLPLPRFLALFFHRSLLLSSLLERLMRAAIIIFQSRVNIVGSLGRTSDNGRQPPSLFLRPSVRDSLAESRVRDCPPVSLSVRPSCVEWHGRRSRPERLRGQSCHVCCARRRAARAAPALRYSAIATAVERADLLSPPISSEDLRSTYLGIVSRTNILWSFSR